MVYLMSVISIDDTFIYYNLLELKTDVMFLTSELATFISNLIDLTKPSKCSVFVIFLLISKTFCFSVLIKSYCSFIFSTYLFSYGMYLFS